MYASFLKRLFFVCSTKPSQFPVNLQAVLQLVAHLFAHENARDCDCERDCAARPATGDDHAVRDDRLAAANLKPRLRMTTLYAFANHLDYRVLGTDNRSELAVGYFTKYGDGGADLLPLGSLVKGEVRDLARHLGVPERIVAKPPSAGLWAGQTDEAEMGLTYEQLDAYLLTGAAPPAVKARVDALHAASAHKRALPRIAPKPGA